MRIAIVLWRRNKIGGAESYLETIIAALHTRGHVLSIFCERAFDDGMAAMHLPVGIVCWDVEILGEDAAINALSQWQPEVLYAHGLENPALEARTLTIAPALFFLHNYRGLCISGQKAHSFPAMIACEKFFGAACLFHFLPRRCGGLNPVRMVRDYFQQTKSLHLFSHYAGLAVASEHMVRACRQNGLRADLLPLYNDSLPVKEISMPKLETNEPLRLAFLGRMETNKGGRLLLDCLPLVAERLQRRIICHFGGAGAASTSWQKQASYLTKKHQNVEVVFRGWLESAQRHAMLTQQHLLIVPSLWPEPFGLVGIEAGSYGVPAVAFDVGGISQWLKHGFNGILAPSDPPTVAGLAAAIVQAVTDPARYAALCQGAREIAHGFSLEKHLDKLEKLLASIIRAPHKSQGLFDQSRIEHS